MEWFLRPRALCQFYKWRRDDGGAALCARTIMVYAGEKAPPTSFIGGIKWRRERFDKEDSRESNLKRNLKDTPINVSLHC